MRKFPHHHYYGQVIWNEWHKETEPCDPPNDTASTNADQQDDSEETPAAQKQPTSED